MPPAELCGAGGSEAEGGEAGGASTGEAAEEAVDDLVASVGAGVEEHEGAVNGAQGVVDGGPAVAN